jgi:hypothetical protein
MSAISPVSSSILPTHASSQQRRPLHSPQHSTIQAAAARDASYDIPVSRPTLSPHLRTIKNVEAFTEIGENRLRHFKLEVDDNLAKLKELSQKQLEKLKETANKTKTNLFWSILKQIASCIASAFSALLGLSVAAAGGSVLISGALITSGILSLANIAFSVTGLWEKAANHLYADDRANRERFLKIVPAAIGITSAALGVAGGAAAWATGVSFANQVTKVAQSTLNFSEGVTTLGSSAATADLQWTAACSREIGAQMFKNQADLESFNSATSHAMTILSSTYKRAHRMVKLLQESAQTILLRG